MKLQKDPFAAVVVSPLMKQAQQLQIAKNIVFVDSISTCDAEQHTITFVLCTCGAGVAPLGVIITKGMSFESYVAGFELMQDAVEKSFANQGYPNIFITDDSSAEINAIK